MTADKICGLAYSHDSDAFLAQTIIWPLSSLRLYWCSDTGLHIISDGLTGEIITFSRTRGPYRSRNGQRRIELMTISESFKRGTILVLPCAYSCCAETHVESHLVSRQIAYRPCCRCRLRSTCTSTHLIEARSRLPLLARVQGRVSPMICRQLHCI